MTSRLAQAGHLIAIPRAGTKNRLVRLLRRPNRALDCSKAISLMLNAAGRCPVVQGTSGLVRPVWYGDGNKISYNHTIWPNRVINRRHRLCGTRELALAKAALWLSQKPCCPRMAIQVGYNSPAGKVIAV